MAYLTSFAALAFLQGDAGEPLTGEPIECRNPVMAIRRAEVLSRQPHVIGAIAFSRNGDRSIGQNSDTVVLRKFGDVPEDLSGL